ncbi:DUF6681 family protein [Levilactobacillus bambusae]|uniref:Uncharacterized protein n=1 Tax=Levilactobacillus bambusae TaxID=2024736 RepID=A0A2V1MZ05_9LACO|nr:DUF6681 family protein [Levilactobacillus bambusae]PWG00042.1 hypothetical protein DCM90_03645 [Levilactobacillus bambusae]
MFSLIDLVNHYLGYVNMNLKLKNRIYTVLGTFGDFYLFYIAFRYMQNGFAVRGLLLLLVAVILLYFVVLNVFYYFTTRTTKFDISPKIEKLMGGHPGDTKDPMLDPEPMPEGRFQTRIHANGYFDEKKILPGKLAVSDQDQANANALAARLQQNGLMPLDYSGLGDRAIYQQTTKLNKPVYASGPGAPIPYFELKEEANQLVVYAGINQAEVQRMGHVSTVGLQDVDSLRDKYKLYLANAILVGGPFKVAGRNTVIEHQGNFEVAVQLAYKSRQSEEIRVQPEDPTPTTTELPTRSSRHRD